MTVYLNDLFAIYARRIKFNLYKAIKNGVQLMLSLQARLSDDKYVSCYQIEWVDCLCALNSYKDGEVSIPNDIFLKGNNL